MRLFNVLLILSIVLFFTLKNINDRNNDDIKLSTITGKRYVCEESLHKVLSILTGLDGYEGLENLIKE